MIIGFGWTGHLGQGLFMEHCSLEFLIPADFESWWCDLGLPKEGISREEEDYSYTQFWGKVKGNYKYFEVEKP